MPLNDEKLILQIQRGNIEYANELIEKHYSSILRYGTDAVDIDACDYVDDDAHVKHNLPRNQ